MMSFILQHTERPHKRRKKYDGVHIKKNETTKNASNSYESLVVVGYQCKIFRDDVVAEYIEDGKHLITWMGDESLLVDRYDCRGYFYNQDDFGLPSSGITDISSDDKHMEEECDKYRYYELNVNEDEHAVVKEESDEWNTPSQASSSAYSSIGYDYENRYSKAVDGDKEYDPNECLDYDDSYQGNENRNPLSAPSKQAQLSYVPKYNDNHLQLMYKKPDGLDIPQGMNVPDSQKSHSIIEKTASFISKHGTQMEIILKAKQAGNPQFDFLNFGNWLNPYYKLILGKIKEGTYKLHQTSASNNDNDESEDSKSDSGSSDSSDEYVHPLLQAHRRPLKTQGETSVESGQKDSVGSSTFEKDMRISSSMLPHQLYANAAEVYMARKYEHLRKDRLTKRLETIDATKNTDNDDWADNLEEDRNFSGIDRSGAQFSYEMLQYMCPPPPPPPSSVTSSTSELNRNNHMTQPPPPGDTFSSVEKPFISKDDSDPQRQQQQQQQHLDHIVPPPPDLKSVVDKLAEYVARNGEVFEEQIKHKHDPRFEFLSASNIYFPYYLYKKQQSIMKMQSTATSLSDDKREKAGKPLSFALKKKLQKSKENKLKSVEIFKSNHGDSDFDDFDDEAKDSLDGYRPNIVKIKSKKIDQNMEEKAKETMEKAKIMIAEAQRKQKQLQQQRDNVDEEVQMERRRKAAAFIGMLKTVKSRETSSSSSETSSDEEGTHRSEEDENSLPKRHFKESKEDL